MAKREKFKNIGQSTLSAGVDASTTTMPITSVSSFPTDGNFRILIDAEIMLVTAVSGSNFTVVRGQEGTTGASHSSGATVTLVLTADSVFRFLKDNVPMVNLTELPPQNSITNSAGTTLTHSDLTWVNQDSATITTLSNGNISLVNPGNAGMHLAVKSAPTAPWVFTVAACYGHHSQDQNWAGIVARESSTGKFVIMFVRGSDATGFEGVDQVGVAYWTDADTFNSNPGSAAAFQTVGRNTHWLRITDNNTNIICESSNDGITWTQFLSASRTAFMAGGPNQIGIVVGCEAAQTFKTSMIVTHWSET